MSREDLAELLAELLVYPQLKTIVQQLIKAELERIGADYIRNVRQGRRRVKPDCPPGYMNYSDAALKYNFTLATMRAYVADGKFTGGKGYVLEQSVADYKPRFIQHRGVHNPAFKNKVHDTKEPRARI